MSINPHDDLGVIEVLMKRLNKQRLPHALALEEKVGGGNKLNDFDMEFLEEVLKDIRHVKPIYDRHPDYQPILTKLMALYTKIIERAALNESIDS
ncbi:hypothetical protein [Teredinibacter purpureus]|uniref:hypothetical protein n=1 Tax=Teredinibacter purpureus TaxID=2731756 RepID=UPI0005F7F5AA|nr:hypothetical protein [Teredinibacter purpureus]